MKRLVTVLLAALVLGACQSPETRVQNVAETFLNAYYTADYEAAAVCCIPELGERISRMAEEMEGVPAQTVQKIKEALARTSFEIVSVELDEDAASALVRYELSVPDIEKPVPKSLTLQLEGRTALVDGIQ
jgi:hypothetical protein